ncbi:TetR/AcrR family transcriptional regulator [Sphingomonas corticis]|uniref:TetR/AcrR family transcriptional regulator n=1 Tax=Sphingomonas corticis TaxID=2722791 RepID=UPI001EEFA2DB|nr:TetR/AcrR family transcriptional regulator [Sphingomonas corticis]
MRYSAEHKAASRDALVRAAARVIREKGFDGVGVDQLSKAAGLTSGSFYKHFDTKAQVLLEVAKAGIDRVAARIRRLRSSPTLDPVGGWVNDFASLHTSSTHLQETGRGCNLPALTPEIVRADGETKEAYQESVRRAVDAMLEEAPLEGEADGRARALAMLALLAGGASMARAVADERLSAEIAESVRRACVTIAATPLSETPRSGIVWTPSDF